MNEMNIQTTPASRREGTVMGIKNNRKRLAATAIAIAGLAGGAVAAHAATFGEVAIGATAPAAFPSITPTCLTDCAVALNAGTGFVTVQDTVNTAQTIPFYGFGVNGKTASLAGSPNSTIKVPLGTTMTITLSQTGVADPIDLSFPSLPAADVSHAGNVYTVHASKVGTSVFQPGSNADAPKQVAMGLVGVLIVTPAGCTSSTLSCGYVGDAGYTDEALVATTDLDADFASNPAAFDMSYFGQPVNADGSARRVYHVVNGKSFPDTDVIDVHAGDKVLVRSVNAGVSDKSMSLLGLRQTLLARNSSAYADPQTLIAPLVGPGETADIAVQIPATAVVHQRYALIDAGRQMNHGNGFGFGGALTFFNVWAANPTVGSLSFDAGTSTLGATGHSAAATLNITGYQTAVTDFATDTPIYSATVAVVPPAANPVITATVTAAAGKFVWIRVRQDDGAFSSGVNIQVPVPANPTVDGLAYDSVTGQLNAVGHASPATSNITGYQTAVTDLATSSPTYSAMVAVAPAANPVITAAVVAGAGKFVWIRVQQDGVAVSSGVNIQVPMPANPTVDGLAYDSGTGQLNAVGHASPAPSNITGYQTAVTDLATSTPIYSATVAVVPPAANPAITAPVTAGAGQYVWVRVQQDGTTFSAGANIQVPVPVKPTVDSATFVSPDLTINASATGAFVSGYQTLVNSGSTPLPGEWPVPVTAVVPPGPSVVIHDSTVTTNIGDTIWVRVQDSNGVWSDGFAVAV